MAGYDSYTSRAYGRISHEKDRPKPAVSIAEREKEARALGLSFGVYMAYLETGYLEQYKRVYQKTMFKSALEKGKVNIIPSKIIGGAYMTIDRVEITPELYARYKAMAAGDLNRYIENGLPEAIVCGYGFYGASLEENEGKFYLLIKTGSSCD